MLMTEAKSTAILRQRFIACYMLQDWNIDHANNAYDNNYRAWMQQIKNDGCKMNRIKTDAINQCIIESTEALIAKHMELMDCERPVIELQIAETIAELYL